MKRRPARTLPRGRGLSVAADDCADPLSLSGSQTSPPGQGEAPRTGSAIDVTWPSGSGRIMQQPLRRPTEKDVFQQLLNAIGLRFGEKADPEFLQRLKEQPIETLAAELSKRRAELDAATVRLGV